MKKSAIQISQYTRIFFLLLWLSLSLLSACKKVVRPLDKLDGPNGLGGEIRFFNASEHIGSQLQQTGPYGISVILIDRPADSLLKTVNLDLMGYPDFKPDNETQTPNIYFNGAVQQQPWDYYRRLGTGPHQVILMDTGRHSLIKDQVDLETGKRTSVYYTDSLGNFRTVISRDAPIRDDTKIGLQVLDLSPDAGRVFFTINNKLPSGGFPANMNYGDATSFISIDNPVTDTLRIRFYSVTDSSTTIVRGFLPASPGYSYTITLKGYMHPASYMDKKNGVPVNIAPDLQLFTTKTH